MKLTQTAHKKITAATLATLLIGLPGCMGWLTGDKSTKKETAPTETKTEAVPTSEQDIVLVSIDNKPLITLQSLQDEKKKLMDSNPQLKAVFAFMPPKQLEQNLAQGLTNQAVVDRYIAEKGIPETKEYQDEMAHMISSVTHMLNTKFFSKNLEVTVTDAEVRDFYDKNKDNIPKLLISHGGVKAMGVQFDSQEKAQAFLTKIQEHKGNLQKAAEATGLKDKVQDFNLVNEQSIGLDAPLRDKIVAMKKIPSTELISVDDKTFWVVQASEKQEPKYQPLETIKTELAKHLEQEKRTELLEQEIEKLRKKYNVTFNEEYFAAEEQGNQGNLKEELLEEEEETV